MEKLLLKVSGLYGLELKLVRKVESGFLSENYILEGGDVKYFLKKYRFDDQARIEEIHSVKKYFFDGGVPVIFPLQTRDGRTFFPLEGGYYALFPFVDDNQFETEKLADESIDSLGETLGKIHLLGKNAGLEIKECFKPWDREATLEKIKLIIDQMGNRKPLSDFDKLAFRNIEMKKRLVFLNKIKCEDLDMPSDHLVHGDYLVHNVFFGENGKVSHVFDLEKADRAPRSYELFRSITYSFFGGDIGPDSLARAKRYFDAYSKVYPISKEEAKKGLMLSYLKSIHRVWVEGEHYLKNIDRVDGFLLADFNRTKYLSNNLDEFEKFLTA